MWIAYFIPAAVGWSGRFRMKDHSLDRRRTTRLALAGFVLQLSQIAAVDDPAKGLVKNC